MCPEQINSKTISLSAKTVIQRAEDIRSNVNSKLKDKANDFKWFSLALDELTDVNDTGQLLFIQGMDAKCELTEELASKYSLHRATIGENS